jgi:3-oxoacyl-[acyl-carrier protein] reductase
MFDLVGKVCLVTGASGLIGLEICRALAQQGAVVLALYHAHGETLRAMAAESFADQGSIDVFECDLRQREALAPLLADLLRRYDRIDVLICCAGKTVRKAAMLTGQADYDDLFDLNVNAPIQLARQLLRPMFRQNGGRIIFIGSHAGTQGLPGQAVYASTKAALHAYAKSLAAEVGERNITVNVVAPGVVADEHSTIYTAEEQQRVCGAIGLRRPGRSAEIASVVAFLASPAAAYISGAVIPVDGAARF